MRLTFLVLLAAAALGVSAPPAVASPVADGDSAGPAHVTRCEDRELPETLRRLCEAVETRECTLARGDDYWLCTGILTGQCGVIRGGMLFWFCEAVKSRECNPIGAYEEAVALCRGVIQDRCDHVEDRGRNRLLCEALAPGVRSLLGYDGERSPDDRPAPRRAIPQPVHVGQSISGELLKSDGVLASTRAYYDAYRLRAVRGQRLEIELTSRDFDAYLSLVPERGTDADPIAEDDDGLGAGTDSRLRAVVPATGTYIVRVTSYERGGSGAYELSVREAAPSPRAVTRPLPFGEAVSGSLTEADPVLSRSWTYYDQYSFEGRPRQEVQVELRASGFAAQVELWRIVEGRWSRLAQGGAGRAGGTARFSATLPAPGPYYVIVRSATDLQTGDYILTARTPLVAPPSIRRLHLETNPAAPDTMRRPDPAAP